MYGTVEERVQTGVSAIRAFNRNDEETFGVVDIDTLDINSFNECLLAQMFGGSYSNGTRALGIYGSAERSCGFHPIGNNPEELAADADELTAEWIDFLHSL